MKRRIVNTVLATLLSVVMVGGIWVSDVSAATVYYEKKGGEIIAKGITYETSTMVTDEGLLDVYVLKIPLDDQHITVGPMTSTKGNGLKERTTKLLNDGGAIAGVNGDFFDMKGSYSSVVGPMIVDGKVMEAGFIYETDSSQYAALFIDKNNNPFIDYISTKVKFVNNGAENIQVRVINKITDMVYAVCVTHDFMADTSVVDSRFAGLTKVVVENGVITYISQKGETVNVPENGFVILISEASADYFTTLVNVGETAEMRIDASVDFDSIRSAIGGGGKILVDGKKVTSGVVPSGRQPRTAVGFSQDRTQMIMMVVDGRGESVGATGSETGDLMLRYGAYNAMHLDGGGSSAMGVKKLGEDTIQLVNTPSDGGQRLVANALGVTSDAPVGSATSLTVKPQADRVFRGTGLPVNVYGLDDYLHTIHLEDAQVIMGFTDVEARYENGYFYPSHAGKITFTATTGELSGSTIIESMEIAQLTPNKSLINAGVGGATALEFTGKSKKGQSGYIYTGVNYEVVPPTLGHMEGDKFVADQEGAGYIKCWVDDVACYIDVNVGFTVVGMTAFEGQEEIKFMGYPEAVTGSVGYIDQPSLNGKGAWLTYSLPVSDQTQGAYLTFPTPISMKKNSYGLKLDVYGDNSYNWLRARLIDGNGKEHPVDLAKQIDWEGWKNLTVQIPSGLAEPVKLDRIYVASTANNDTTERTLYFDNLSCEAMVDHGRVERPEDTRFNDPISGEIVEAPEQGFDLTVAGDMSLSKETKPDGYAETQKKAVDFLKRNSSRILFAGTADEITDDIGVKMYKWNKNYNANTHENVLILQMSAAQGNIYTTNPKQWESFYNDISNSAADHIVIQMDLSPLNFSVAKELLLFQDLLENLHSNTGKNIIVVSTEGTNNSVDIKNGIRYINLGGLWKPDGSVNPEFRILRLRVNGTGLKYGLQKMN